MNNTLVIEEFEAILNGSRDFNEATDNRTMLTAYKNSKAAGNFRLDFNNEIWDYDIKPIADIVRMNGIKEFTISVRQGNLIDVLWSFQEMGIFVKGIVKVNIYYKPEQVSAVLMQVA